MKSKFLLIIALQLAIITYSFSQKQGNIWYFGDRAGIDFNSGTPLPITDGQINKGLLHSEGTATISDSSGSLLFYSNGEKVWDKNPFTLDCIE